MKYFTLLLFVFAASGTFAQSMIEKMYRQKRYQEIVEMADQTHKLGGQNIFVIGQSYLKLNQPAEALEMFDQAIDKGYKNVEVYYARGIALAFLDRQPEAQQSFRQALYYHPDRKKVMIELAASYYNDNQKDSALVVYKRIEKNWGDYLPAVLMVCLIEHEEERYREALECYKSKLFMLKRDPYYYREGLMAVIRLEWHHFKNYTSAEKALKNLLDAFPDNREDNMLMMQFYNNIGRYADAALQEQLIMDAYKNVQLGHQYYEKGAFLVDDFEVEQYHIEVFRNFQTEKNEGTKYRAFIFNFDGSRGLGKIEGKIGTSAAWLNGYTIEGMIELPKELTYEQFREAMLRALFAPAETKSDSTDLEKGLDVKKE